MIFTRLEIEQTLRMFREQNLDIRTITMGISLLDCADSDPKRLDERVYEKVVRSAAGLVETADAIGVELGIPIINKRISVTPVALVAGAASDTTEGTVRIAKTLERAAVETGVDFLGGFSALVHKGVTPADIALIRAIPEALAETTKVCASANVASSKSGINMDAVLLLAEAIKSAAARTSTTGGSACSRLVVFANAPEDNPFMAGAFHGTGEPDVVVHVGVSGPGVVQSAVAELTRGGGNAGDPAGHSHRVPLDAIAETVKRTAFRITRIGQLVLDRAAARLGVPSGIVDLSLAPTPAVGDSVARILEEMGLEIAGAPGSTAALALLNNAVKKGGMMASSHVGGLSGSFLPVSEDEGMAAAAEKGALTLEKLEAMTAICSVGLDMVALPGDTTVETIAGIMADEMAIGVMNHKTTAVRLIPVPGGTAGQWVEFGGLLGRAPIMPVSPYASTGFVRRGGLIPAPVTSYRN